MEKKCYHLVQLENNISQYLKRIDHKRQKHSDKSVPRILPNNIPNVPNFSYVRSCFVCHFWRDNFAGASIVHAIDLRIFVKWKETNHNMVYRHSPALILGLLQLFLWLQSSKQKKTVTFTHPFTSENYVVLLYLAFFSPNKSALSQSCIELRLY